MCLGIGLARDVGGDVLRQFAVAEFVDVFHAALPSEFTAQLVHLPHLGEQFQRALRFLLIQLLQGVADMHDDVIADDGVVHQRQRDLFAHTAQIDDGVARSRQLFDAGGNGETHG